MASCFPEMPDVSVLLGLHVLTAQREILQSAYFNRLALFC